MSADYIKLAEAPTLTIRYPQCGACGVDVDSEDGWVCPVCGTFWQYDAGDGDSGDFYESWSGEVLDGDAVDEEAAFKAGMKHERDRVAATWARIDARKVVPA